MEFFTELFLVALPFFILGYVTGKVQNELDRMFLRECSKEIEISEEEESPFPSEEKLKQVEKWEKEIYDIHTSYEENQAFSNPSQKYVCLGEFCGNAPVLIACNTTDEICKIERKIKDFFGEEIVNLSVEKARKYVAEYGYHLISSSNPWHKDLYAVPKRTKESFLRRKTLTVSTEDKKNITKINKKQTTDAKDKKEESYVKGILSISYKAC